MSDVVIVDGARTAHGELLGSLSDLTAVDLGEAAVQGLVDRNAIDADGPDWVGLGNAVQAGVGQVPARQVVVESVLDDSVAATTVNEASGSGLRAIALAVDRIRAGRADVCIGGGMESMSNAPYLVRDMRSGRRHGNTELVDAMIHDSLWDLGYDAHMGELTDELLAEYDVSRLVQDEYALRSNRRAVDAIDDGVFEEEIVPLEVGDHLVAADEGPRPDTSLERFGSLEPAFSEDGTITAGNASKLSDGAGAVLLADAEVAADRGLGPMAHVEDYAVAYRDPSESGLAVIDAFTRLLDRNELAPDDVDHYELNEAFAGQTVLARERLDVPDDRLNPHGGAVALGHPIGASGGILTTTLVHSMERADHTWGVVGMTVGGGGGIAMLCRR
jgi:acetyl-CoA C-acetyltransferase